jgi:glucose/arabinose dehydrogenase
MSTLRLKTAVFLVVSASFLLGGAAQAQSYAAAWTFGNVDFSAYRLDAFEPGDILFPPLGSENPTLPLVLGQRYQVKITNFSVHPFEIIGKASSAGQDKVLLSMAIQGPFESDLGVAWEDDNKGTVRFTLTASLYQAMVEGGRTPGYRCRPHSSMMRGDFTVSGLPIAEHIEASPVRVNLQTVASGLAAPVILVPDPVQPARLYIVDQVGLVRVADQGQLLDTPFLDMTHLVVPVRVNYDERGFLGLAFHPDFADPNSPGYGQFYTYASEPVQGQADFTVELPSGTMNHQSVVREWLWDGLGEQVDPNSSREVLRVDQPQSNHNGGHIAFGSDGFLYIGFGDGGSANDTAAGHGTQGNGQNINTVLGSILRIDPLDPNSTMASANPVGANGAYRIPIDNPFVGIEGIDEIYAYGFRNPYRFSFDALSGALIVADVGQNHVEEINFVHAGRNYGWNIKEGTFAFDPLTADAGLPLVDPSLSDPVVQYDHDDGLSVIGGYTYYGAELPEFWGQYLCGDFSRQFSAPEGRLFVADLFAGTIQELLIGAAGRPLDLFVKGFGQDLDGEVYLLASTALGPVGDTGVVLKIVASPTEFVAQLSGEGTGTAVASTGQAVFTLNGDEETLSYQLDIQEAIENVTMAHIHIAAVPGGNGPPAVWLYPAAPPAVTIPGTFSGVLDAGTFTADSFVGPLAGLTVNDLLAAIRENRAYVNVHTVEFPGGAIRGPVKAVQEKAPTAAVLTGAAAGADSTGTGLATLRPGPDAEAISFELNVQGLTNITMAHIHIASEPGGTGAPAVWLYPATPPAMTIPGEFTGLLSEGTITSATLVGPLAGLTLSDLMTAIQENRAYVNVHTQQFPGGEIRGWLE